MQSILAVSTIPETASNLRLAENGTFITDGPVDYRRIRTDDNNFSLFAFHNAKGNFSAYLIKAYEDSFDLYPVESFDRFPVILGNVANQILTISQRSMITTGREIVNIGPDRPWMSLNYPNNINLGELKPGQAYLHKVQVGRFTRSKFLIK